MRLQFNAAGKYPQEIETHNLHWTTIIYQEQRKETPDRKFVCDPSSINGSGTAITPVFPAQLPNCSYVDFPTYHEVDNTVVFLTFEKPISAKQIKLNSHGADLPKWDTGELTQNLGSIYFHGEMAHMILDVEVVN